MAIVKSTFVRVEAAVVLELNESEIRALDGIFGYDVEIFLKVFYERMGRAYVQKHEAGVRSLYATIRGQLARPLALVDEAKQTLYQGLYNAK